MQKQKRQNQLIQGQISQNLAKLAPLREMQHPGKGWIRSIRQALGMSGRQLAERMGVEPPRITEMEKAEAGGTLTLRTLRRAAEALDCRLVYALVPNTSLEDTLRRQATTAARERLKRVSHSMRLEDQALSSREEAELLRERAEELMREMPRSLWDARAGV
jgi:predicted DNA-binding mobile mystery protein A